MRFRFNFLYLAIIITTNLNGQNFLDALLYSQYDILGTARTIGVGGGLGALGTDFGVLSTNPAGLALNRKSEFVITPAFLHNQVESTILDNEDALPNKEGKGKILLNNFGLVVFSSPRRSPKWKTMNFSIGFNKLADFNREYSFDLRGPGSLLEDYLLIANDNLGFDLLDVDPFGTYVANQALAIYTFEPPDDDGFYHSDFELTPNPVIAKEQTITEEGSVNELTFALSGNYDEKVMFGISIGVPIVRFSQEKTYREIDDGSGADGTVPFFEEMEFQEDLTTTGTGFNAKLGLIFRFNQAFRLGVAAHTPTSYSLEESFTSTMVYSYTDQNGFNTETGLSPEGNFRYRLRTPWRFIGSAGYLINRAGFLTGEVELVNYTQSNFNFDGSGGLEDDANREIDDELSSAINVRLGGEFAYQNFRFRAGVGLLQSPFEGDTDFSNTFSAGFGIRQRSFYVDLAYRYNTGTDQYSPYDAIDPIRQINVENNLNRNLIVATLGIRY